MTMRRTIGVAAVLFALAAVLGCGRGGNAAGDGAGAESEPVVPVRLATLVQRRFADEVTAPGQWRSGGDLVIAVPTPGVIERLSVQVGDRVRAGQHVGTLIPRDSWASLQGAQLLVREARDAASREEAQRSLALARRELVRVPLAVSEAGVVLRRSIEPGGQIAEGAEVLAVVPWKRLVFEARVPTASASRVHAGETARIVEEGGLPRTARVQQVLPTAGGADQATLVWLAWNGAGKAPELERFGTAQISVGTPRMALATPDSAVVEDDLTGERRLAVVDASSRAHWIAVRLGGTEGGWREVLGGGLGAGTRVVASGQRGLPDSTRVKPIP